MNTNKRNVSNSEVNTMHIIHKHRCRQRHTLDVQGIVVGVIVGLVLLWGIAPWIYGS